MNREQRELAERLAIRRTVEQHRQYYQSMERRLVEIGRYVALEEDNYRAYSVELLLLLQAAGSEFDTLARIHCVFFNKVNGHSADMRTFRGCMMMNAPNLVTHFETDLMARHCKVMPFHWWGNAKGKRKLPWWEAYNRIKHNRGQHYKAGNVRNAILAMSACLAALCLYPRQNRDAWDWVGKELNLFRITQAIGIKMKPSLEAVRKSEQTHFL